MLLNLVPRTAQNYLEKNWGKKDRKKKTIEKKIGKNNLKMHCFYTNIQLELFHKETLI